MRVLRKCLFPFMAVLLLVSSSCSSDDYELYKENGKTETWEYELRNIVSDFGFLFENSGVKFLQAEELRHRVDTLDFINEETCYPVCIRNLYNFFLLRSLDFVINDTISIHMPSDNIKDMVSSIVENQDKYDFIRLTWLYCNKKFETVAVFDKLNGEIVYDNILTNIPLSQMELPSHKTKLTRAEGGGIHVETRVFYKDRLTVPNRGYFFDYRIKCLCNVLCSEFSNPILLLDFERIEEQLSCPDYPQNMFNPTADVVIYGGNIYYYLWVGEGNNAFSLTYDSDDPGENAFDLWTDKHDRHMWPDSVCNVKRVGFYSSLNAGSYQPDPGWNF